ncbi:glycosyltransferase family 4 protein [Bifidobacterium eulemuris]|nr:glycosyltransferase family 4 protein [Bifidobacterium eulemuris]
MGHFLSLFAEKRARSQATAPCSFESPSKETMLYCTAFSVYTFVVTLGYTNFQTIFGPNLSIFTLVCQMWVLACLAVKFFLDKNKSVNLVLSLILIVVAFLSWHFSGESWLLWLVFFVICGNGIQCKKLAYASIFGVVPVFLVTVISASLGFIHNEIIYGANGIVRYSMGFLHPNSFSRFLFVICVAFVVIRFGKNSLLDIAFMLIVALFSFLIAGSRTTALLLIVGAVLLFVFYCVKGESSERIIVKGLSVAVILEIIASFYFMVFFNENNRIHFFLNMILSDRLKLSHEYFKIRPFSFWGLDSSAYPMIGGYESFTVDNAFCHLYLRQGLLPSIFFMIGFFLLLFKIMDEERLNAFVFGFIMMAFYSFSESVGLMVECNYFLITLGSVLFSRRKMQSDIKGKNALPNTINHIVFVLPHFAKMPAGGYKMVFLYANHLASRGCKITICFDCKNALKKVWIPELVRKFICRFLVLYYPDWYDLRSDINKSCIFGIKDENLPDANHVVATAVETATPVAELSSRKGLKHYLIQDYETWVMSEDEVRRTYSLGMSNIVVSDWLAELVQEATGVKPTLIKNPVDESIFYPDEVDRQNHEIAALYHVQERKGFSDLFQALESAKKDVPDLIVNVFGTPDRPEWFPSWFRYTQNATPEQLRGIYSRSAIFACATRSEGFGLTLAESMFCGCALVSTSFKGVYEYANTSCALLSPVRCPASLADNLIMLLKDPEEARRIANLGKIHARRECSMAQAFKSLEEEFDV